MLISNTIITFIIKIHMHVLVGIQFREWFNNMTIKKGSSYRVS